MTEFHRLSALLAVAISFTATAARADGVVEIKQTASTGGSAVGTTTIVVEGPGAVGYQSVTSATLQFWVTVSGRTPDNSNQWKRLTISADGSSINGRKPGEPEVYLLNVPYAAPRAEGVVNQRISPIEVCNAELAKRSGAARTEFLKSGGTVMARDAYALRAVSTWELWPGGIGFKEPYSRDFTGEAMADAVIRCKPLGLPQRTPGTPLRTPSVPFVSDASLRIEPAQVVTVGKQLCPSQLRLYGQVQAGRAFEGKAVIFGPGYISPVTALSFPHPGNRNIVATYPLRWDLPGGLSAGATDAPKSQTVNLTMNVTSQNNTVIKQVKETVSVTCKFVAVVNPQPNDEMTAKPAPAAAPPRAGPAAVVSGAIMDGAKLAEPRPVRIKRTSQPDFFVKRSGSAALLDGIDSSIRLVDRRGPGGVTRLFVRNSGTLSGTECKVYAASKRDGYKGWIELGSTQLQTGRDSTVQFAGALPTDPGLRFAVDCPGEPDDRLDDNVADLP